MQSYTKVHFDLDTLPWLTSPRKKLGLEGVALGLIKLPASEGYTFTHSHRKQEEVYIVIEGSGVMVVDGALLDLEKGDIVRVSPQAKRALKANDSGMLLICAGAVPLGYPINPNARYLIDDGIADYDDIPCWYQGDADVAQKNKELKRRMQSRKTRIPLSPLKTHEVLHLPLSRICLDP